MLKNGYVTWLLAVAAGVAATIAAQQLLLRGGLPWIYTAPISQGIGLTAAHLTAWPWYSVKPDRRLNFVNYLLAFFAPNIVVVAFRIAFRTG